jgi:hypothetical protein
VKERIGRAISDLPEGPYKTLVLWIAERAERDELRMTALETKLALLLIEAGHDPASAKAAANSWARLLVFRVYESLRELHSPANRISLARRASAIAAHIRKIEKLKYGKVLACHAKQVTKEIREVGARLGWSGAVSAAELFDRLQVAGREAVSLAEIELVAATLDRLSSDFKTIARTIAVPLKMGRRRSNRIFGFQVELLAQSYFRETGKLPRDEVYERDGHPQGGFIDLVARTIKGSKQRPSSRKASAKAEAKALAKAIIRVLDNSPRTDVALRAAALIERDQAEARQRLGFPRK